MMGYKIPRLSIMLESTRAGTLEGNRQQIKLQFIAPSSHVLVRLMVAPHSLKRLPRWLHLLRYTLQEIEDVDLRYLLCHNVCRCIIR